MFRGFAAQRMRSPERSRIHLSVALPMSVRHLLINFTIFHIESFAFWENSRRLLAVRIFVALSHVSFLFYKLFTIHVKDTFLSIFFFRGGGVFGCRTFFFREFGSFAVYFVPSLLHYPALGAITESGYDSECVLDIIKAFLFETDETARALFAHAAHGMAQLFFW
jgi:hypothetical protein